MKRIIFLIAICTLSACSKDDMPQYSKLDRLRILGLVVNTPELQNPAAGTVNVNLDPYISDIGGTGAVSLDVQSCLDPGVSLGKDATCAGGTSASSVQTVAVAEPTGQAAGIFGAPERTGRPSTGSIVVPLTIPANFLSPYSAALQFNGVAYIITVKATSSTGTVSSFRRVLISNKSPNANPTLSDLLVDGASLTTLPGADANLSSTFSSSPETYQYMSNDGSTKSFTETFETTWFVSDGEVEIPRTFTGETTVWKAPVAASGRKSVVVGVLRDGRGGISVMVKLL